VQGKKALQAVLGSRGSRPPKIVTSKRKQSRAVRVKSPEEGKLRYKRIMLQAKRSKKGPKKMSEAVADTRAVIYGTGSPHAWGGKKLPRKKRTWVEQGAAGAREVR